MSRRLRPPHASVTRCGKHETQDLLARYLPAMSRSRKTAISDDHDETGAGMYESVLPQLPTDEVSSQLPVDPAALLSADELADLRHGLTKLAKLRRDAETSSGSLRLA